ncbi:hypothetical protein STIAU_1246 [Stigmatella aurantiaca DW4/3-1]|uniref:Uncharacterized protein n=1 Tax=Stigmatella aurantiaca (strain DW4/3-1) TaxID=378806 RepID=Q08TV1_STIAD|nr:hypothetical protein STIAU_1246 [Stigmatella aurantiaca DW4/3-1]
MEVFVHERRGGVAELQPAGAEWRVRWLRGTADLNRQGSGTAMVRVTAPGLYRVRSVASALRASSAPRPRPPRVAWGQPSLAAGASLGLVLPPLRPPDEAPWCGVGAGPAPELGFQARPVSVPRMNKSQRLLVRWRAGKQA